MGGLSASIRKHKNSRRARTRPGRSTTHFTSLPSLSITRLSRSRLRPLRIALRGILFSPASARPPFSTSIRLHLQWSNLEIYTKFVEGTFQPLWRVLRPYPISSSSSSVEGCSGSSWRVLRLSPHSRLWSALLPALNLYLTHLQWGAISEYTRNSIAALSSLYGAFSIGPSLSHPRDPGASTPPSWLSWRVL